MHTSDGAQLALGLGLVERLRPHCAYRVLSLLTRTRVHNASLFIIFSVITHWGGRRSHFTGTHYFTLVFLPDGGTVQRMRLYVHIPGTYSTGSQ